MVSTGAFTGAFTGGREPRLENLRTALALNRGMELLSQITRSAEQTVEHDETRRVGYLLDLYLRIHTEMFQDWKDQNAARPGDIPSGASRDAVRQAVLQVLCGGNGAQAGTPAGLFDGNGYVIHHGREALAEVLTQFYETMRAIRPFGYGNELTLDFFMVALGKLPAFQEVYPQGIDLRRLDAEDIRALHAPGRHEEVKTAFIHALDPARTPALKNDPNGYGIWEKHVAYVSGIPFLSHQKDGVAHLVTVNGGLVPLPAIREELEAFLKTDRLFAASPPIPHSRISGYLPGTESLRAAGKTDIDGIAVTDRAAPLFCLDAHILTGLRSPAHSTLLAMIEEAAGKGTPLFRLANNEEFRKELERRAAGDAHRLDILNVAHDRLSRITRKLNQAEAEIFMHKTPAEKPRLYISMGGAGAGKTAAGDMVRAECGTNFVEASLDEFRKRSDLYKVLTAANHHGDDYMVIEPFANSLREWVAATARHEKINVLYDGTGVTYQPRYADVVRNFKQAGFQTRVIGVDVPLEMAVERVKTRFEASKRALPWIVVTGKHTRTPRSFVQAVEDTRLDKVALFANDGAPGQHFLVAESFVMRPDEVKAMKQAQRDGALHPYLASLITRREDSLLQTMAGHDAEKLKALLAKNPQFSEDNVSFTVYPGPEKSRVLAVYHTERYTELMKKGLMNPHASHVDGLRHTPATLPFYLRLEQDRAAKDASGRSAP